MNFRARSHGFTLIELIMVLMLLGVLAVVLVPRINPQEFGARGFHDETLALMRYAQKTAIAQRRTVCVAFTPGTATLNIAAASAINNCTVALVGPRGETPASVTAGNGTSYLATPVDFFFNALGQPSVGQTFQVASGGAAIGLTITVWAETGYVQ